MLKLTAIIATLAVACLLLVVLLNGPAKLIGALFITAAAAMAVLLFLAYSLIAPLTGSWIQIKRSILAHIVLHTVLASYVALKFLMATTLLINTIYLLPIVLFFYTGRRTWAGLFDLFGRKMYRIYYFGNTALMQTCPILLALGFLVDESIGTVGFRQATVGYFSIHCLITGLTMIYMEKDILSQKASAIAR